MMKGLKRTIFVLSCLFLLMPTGGCQQNDTDTKLVLYTGFKKDEVFRIETMSCIFAGDYGLFNEYSGSV